MDLLAVSPTSQSIDYKSMHCNKKLTSKLLPNKESSDAVRLFEDIKRNIILLDKSLSNEFFYEDAHTVFVVNIEINRSNYKVYRQPIPEFIRHEAWRRDQGKCVICGSQQNLEFDHIIPFSKGGSNTARNIQLLCETCNRSKHARI